MVVAGIEIQERLQGVFAAMASNGIGRFSANVVIALGVHHRQQGLQPLGVALVAQAHAGQRAHHKGVVIKALQQERHALLGLKGLHRRDRPHPQGGVATADGCLNGWQIHATGLLGFGAHGVGSRSRKARSSWRRRRP